MKIFGTLAMAAVILAAGASGASAEQRLAIGATAATSPFYGYFVSVANIVNDTVPEVSAHVTETGATVENLHRIGRGQLDLGLVTTNTMSDAYYGKGKFDGRPVDAKVLWVYFVAPQMTLVREDSGVESFSDLEGKPFHTGLRGSSTEATTDAVLDTLGVSVDPFRAGAADGVNAVKDGRVVGWTASSMGNKFSSTQIDAATFSPLHPVGLSDDEAEKVKTEHPQLAIVDIPAGAAEGVPAFSTWAFGLATAASADLDEETAYRIVKAVMENRSTQTDAMKATGDIDFAQATIGLATSPLHPGAIRYLREQGYEVPERLIAKEDR